MTKYNYVVNEKKNQGPQKSSCKSVALFIFNPKTGAFMGRTASSWAKIILFYSAFYAVLGGLFAFLGWVSLQTLDKRFPTFMLDESLIGTSPGLGFRPLPLIMTQDNMLISYNVSSGNYSAYTKGLNHFLEEYTIDTKNSSFVPCNRSSAQSEDGVCTEDVNNWFPCTKENDFGYKNGTPCVFIKLNKIIGWKPEYYDVENLPKSMPQDLRSHIDELKGSRPDQLKTIWVTCGGDRPEDKMNIGPIKYIPRRGFWGYYFPYTNQPHYITPLMAIQFEKPARGILIFYAVFYSALAALFAICLQGLLLTLDTKNPRWLLDSSLIGTNPGLGFRPIFGSEDSALIWYNASNHTSYKKWADQLDKFLEPYIVTPGKNQQACDYNRPPAEGKACDVPISDWEPCTREMGYGYNKSSPCIFIKLNKIIGWLPEYYKNIGELPDAMPADLKEYIRIKHSKTMNMVWVSCDGESATDKANLGQIEYIPDRGFPGYYYPYRNIDGYLSPLIAVHLVRPKLNALINIECRAWAKNIHYSHTIGYREGSVHFEVMID